MLDKPRFNLLGHPTDRMPHVTAVSFVYADADAVAAVRAELGAQP